MKKSGLISLTIILSIIGIFLYLPYLEFYEIEHKIRHDNQLIDHWKNSNYTIKLILITLFYPLLLVIESTFWKGKKNLWKRFILVSQSILIAIGGFFIWFIMTVHFFTGSYEFKLPYYFISGYLLVGSIWNIFLSMPFYDKYSLIIWPYDQLSLRKSID